MKNIIRNLLFVILLIGTLCVNAQKSELAGDNQLALQYYRNGEYEKAVEIYRKLYYETKTETYFTYYLKCLTELKDYKEAEKLIKLHLKANSFDLRNYVELGYIYQLEGDESKAKSTYLSAIKKIESNQHQAISLANAFINKGLYEYAEQTYFDAKKQINNSYGFHIELAWLYYYQRNYDKMISQYLDLLEVNEQYIQSVQNNLQSAVYNDIDGSLKQKLNDALLARVQDKPEVTVFSELLIWLYIQDSDFKSAFIQARALDLRLGEDGKRIIALARIASDNDDYSTAIKAYEYVIEKGRNVEYFYAARNEMLEVMFKRIDLGLDAKREDFVRMEQSYINALTELGTNSETADMIKNLAHIQAFYLGKTAEAIFLLEDVVTMPRIDARSQALFELELADIYLAAGNIWDATFTYARVEEKNKNNPVGAEAKYRKAKLAYYIGNYEWSMAQLDVLKGSTSKLIANDAARLSLFIYDNTGWGDSLETAMGMYSRADLLYYQSQDSLAIATLDSITTQFADHALADDAWYLKGQIYKDNNRFDKAEEAYLKVVNDFEYEVLADKSLYALAYIFENETGNKEKALEYYKKLLLNYQGSVYTVEARNRFRKLRGDDNIN